jgi:hypothetical protein
MSICALIGVNDHPHSGWLGFKRHRRQKTGARSAPVVAGETGCEAPGLENPISLLTLPLAILLFAGAIVFFFFHAFASERRSRKG